MRIGITILLDLKDSLNAERTRNIFVQQSECHMASPPGHGRLMGAGLDHVICAIANSDTFLSNDYRSMVEGNFMVLVPHYQDLADVLELGDDWRYSNVPAVNTLIDYHVFSNYINLTSTHVGEHLKASFSETCYVRYFWSRPLGVDGGSAGLVLKARLVSEGDPTKGHDVVCKIGWTADHIEALRREKDAYLKLADLQGRFIPYFMGVFEGEVDDSPMVYLIMSYAGGPLKRPLVCYPRIVR